MDSKEYFATHFAVRESVLNSIINVGLDKLFTKVAKESVRSIQTRETSPNERRRRIKLVATTDSSKSRKASPLRILAYNLHAQALASQPYLRAIEFYESNWGDSSKHTFERAHDILRSPSKAWKTEDLATRQTLLKACFDGPLLYSRKNNFRAPKLTPVFNAGTRSELDLVGDQRIELWTKAL
jgi:hypothetical protein